MAITGYGYDGTVAELPWSELHDMLADDLVTGCQVSARPSSTRTLDVQTGKAYGGGVMAKIDAAATITVAANGSGNPRIDLICVKHDWTGVGGASALAVVQGSVAATPQRPTFSNVPGSVWFVPLAAVTVQPGVGQIAGGDVEDIRPTRRKLKLSVATPAGGQSVARTATNPSNIATIQIADPGWQHRLRISAKQQFTSTSDGLGYGRIDVTVDGNTVGLEGRTPKGCDGTADLYGVVGPYSGGGHTLRLRMLPQGTFNDANLVTSSAFARFSVEIDPV